MNPYIGHDTQYYGVEEHRLVGGKGDGMARRLLVARLQRRLAKGPVLAALPSTVVVPQVV